MNTTQTYTVQGINPRTISSHPLANEILPKLGLPKVRKTGFPYFVKLSPEIAPGTKPNAAKPKLVARRKKLLAVEIDALLE